MYLNGCTDTGKNHNTTININMRCIEIPLYQYEKQP